MKPKATFVCPTYNNAGYLAETVESILQQTINDWELVVVDDGSTDTTESLMRYYEDLDQRIRYLKLHKNAGCVNARNRGNEIANGQIICVIDHDDLCHPDRLKWTLKHFEKHPDTDIFHGGWTEANIHGIPHEQFRPMKITADLISRPGYLFCHSTAAYPKKVIKKYPYYVYEEKTDDGVIHKTDDLAALELWTKEGLTFRATNRVLCNVRRLPMGQMQQIRAAKGLPPSWRP